MQKTKFSMLIEEFWINLVPLISDSWKKRSILLMSLLFGYYFTNSLISFLLDKSVNTIILAFIILLIMELSIRSVQVRSFSRYSLSILIVNNLRIGSTYALILEAFKLGS